MKATKPIIKRLNSYEDACELTGKQPKTLEDFKALYEDEGEAQYYLSHHRITRCIEVINEGHVFDYNDYDEGKCFPIWDMETYGDAVPGSGFSLYDVYFDYTGTLVGARLSTISEERARHICKICHDDYFIIMKK